MSYIFFDIETKPRPELVEKFIKPFAKFDPDSVKYGNTKDPVLRSAKLVEEAAKHAKEEAAYWQDAKDRAALNPITAEIIAIGIRTAGGESENLGAGGDTERGILENFWAMWADPENAGKSFVFWSGNGSATDNFDPDFIIRRSWITGVEVPASAFNGEFLARRFLDLARRYLLGKRDAHCGLSRCANELGLYGENSLLKAKAETDVVTGANFWEFWESNEDDKRTLAAAYLRNDLLHLKEIAKRIL